MQHRNESGALSRATSAVQWSRDAEDFSFPRETVLTASSTWNLDSNFRIEGIAPVPAIFALPGFDAPDSQLIVAGYGVTQRFGKPASGMICVVDSRTGKTLRSVVNSPELEYFGAVALAPDAPRIIAVARKRVFIFDFNGSCLASSREDHVDAYSEAPEAASVALVTSERVVVRVGESLHFYDSESLKHIATETHRKWASVPSVCVCGNQLVVSDTDGNVFFRFDVDSGKPTSRVQIPDELGRQYLTHGSVAPDSRSWIFSSAVEMMAGSSNVFDLENLFSEPVWQEQFDRYRPNSLRRGLRGHWLSPTTFVIELHRSSFVPEGPYGKHRFVELWSFPLQRRVAVALCRLSLMGSLIYARDAGGRFIVVNDDGVAVFDREKVDAVAP